MSEFLLVFPFVRWFSCSSVWTPELSSCSWSCSRHCCGGRPAASAGQGHALAPRSHPSCCFWRFLTLGPTWCSRSSAWAFPAQPWSWPVLQVWLFPLETGPGCLFWGVTGDFLSQTSLPGGPRAPVLSGTACQRSGQLACLPREPGATPLGGARLPLDQAALLAGLQVGHHRGIKDRSLRGWRGLKRWYGGRHRGPWHVEPLSGASRWPRCCRPCCGLRAAGESRVEGRESRDPVGVGCQRPCCCGCPAPRRASSADSVQLEGVRRAVLVTSPRKLGARGQRGRKTQKDPEVHELALRAGALWCLRRPGGP